MSMQRFCSLRGPLAIEHDVLREGESGNHESPLRSRTKGDDVFFENMQCLSHFYLRCLSAGLGQSYENRPERHRIHRNLMGVPEQAVNFCDRSFLIKLSVNETDYRRGLFCVQPRRWPHIGL